MNKLTKVEKPIQVDWEIVEKESKEFVMLGGRKYRASKRIFINPPEMAHDFIVRNPEVPVEGIQFYLEIQGLKHAEAKQVAHEVFGKFLIP